MKDFFKTMTEAHLRFQHFSLRKLRQLRTWFWVKHRNFFSYVIGAGVIGYLWLLFFSIDYALYCISTAFQGLLLVFYGETITVDMEYRKTVESTTKIVKTYKQAPVKEKSLQAVPQAQVNTETPKKSPSLPWDEVSALQRYRTRHELAKGDPELEGLLEIAQMPSLLWLENAKNTEIRMSDMHKEMAGNAVDARNEKQRYENERSNLEREEHRIQELLKNEDLENKRKTEQLRQEKLRQEIFKMKFG